MTASDAVQVSIEVALDPRRAFEVFTGDIDRWWLRGPRYRFLVAGDGPLRLEPGVNGRLYQSTHDGESTFEVGRVLDWQPGRRLLVSWRLPNFTVEQSTEVEVSFDATERGTRVTVIQRGFDGLPDGHPSRHGLVGQAFVMARGRWWADLLLAMRVHAGNGGPELQERKR